ncbi:MAG: glycosyltransferase, partial [Ruminiclostridium sp.]|nr:glycosyltransferase [Ruminiclostridium sp.]MBQ8841102.1 glycosyltransferase [Ruminiclostridium sp.]
MLLTIGMIVKNEEKYLEQCLNGIKPILEQVDSELIIADTGSTDRTVEIAKKFTDNVFYFEWIKDFSAARNSTLEKAKGEWFMFVDGDEV